MIDKNEEFTERTREFIRLVTENPDLPIVAMVDGAVCDGEDSGTWLGIFSYASVDEYLIPKTCGAVIFKSDDDVFDTLERYLSYEKFGALPTSDDECRKIYDALPWKKAIVVYIDVPN